jgi:hypothetical protein
MASNELILYVGPDHPAAIGPGAPAQVGCFGMAPRGLGAKIGWFVALCHIGMCA